MDLIHMKVQTDFDQTVLAPGQVLTWDAHLDLLGVAELVMKYFGAKTNTSRTLAEKMHLIRQIGTLDAGVTNCAVTKLDVRNADAIFGSSIPALRGKTHKMTSTEASPILLPRVTQVQQILVVDLFYIKQMPFLLGELVPLGLALCTPAKDRTAAVIAAGIRSFINTAKSRDFDCVQLRTDGEGALAAMAMELAGLGIVVDVAGPGQHVPVVERKIQTIKERVRAHENSLPYVMTRLTAHDVRSVLCLTTQYAA